VGLERYVAATVLTVLAILSQYFLPQAIPALLPLYASYLGDFLIVYGVPILAFVLLVGWGPLRNWDRNVGTGFVEGFRWYGLLTVVGLLLSIVAIVVIVSAIGPSAVNVLSKPTPVVKAASADPYLWVALSFLIGFVEETIFRGWIFGYWLMKDPGRWKVHAAWTSMLFAGVHVYYALTYGIVFVLPLIILIADGLAFAIGFRYSGGSLIGIAFLHGWNDATAFLALPLPALGLSLHYLVVLIGVIIAVVLYLRQQRSSVATRELRPI
jgi:membrane protease YdiL (CAAX protease family)